MAATSLNEVEAMADRGERIAAYRALLTAEPAHSLAWFNLAVDELDDGAVVAARRALLCPAVKPPIRAMSSSCSSSRTSSIRTGGIRPTKRPSSPTTGIAD